MNDKTILIAEDDVLLRSALEGKLTREGFAVHVARNGEECVAKALELHPDLILLDILMPKMDGIEVLKELRDDAWGESAKILMLTNVADAQRVVESGPYRSDGYLVKSDTKIGDVVAKVREQLAIAKLATAALTSEDFQLTEYRCACGKLLFKGALLFSTIEIKCKRCGEIRRIDNTDHKPLG